MEVDSSYSYYACRGHVGPCVQCPNQWVKSKIWCRDQDQAVEDRRVSERFGQNLDYTIKNQGQKW